MFKKLFFLFVLTTEVFGAERSIVGTFRVGDSDAAISSSTLAEFSSTTKGAIPCPKMTTTQRNAISSPQVGHCVFNTSTNRQNIYDGAAWQESGVSSATSSPDQNVNLGVSASTSSNVMTIALKDSSGVDPSSSSPVLVGLRSSTATTGTYSQRSIAAAQNLALSVYSTLGLVSGVAGYVYVYEIDSDGSGTMKMGAASQRYDESSLVTTMKESDTVTITIASPGVLTVSSNTLANGDAVILTNSGGALPTGLTAGTTYYVVHNATDGAGKFRLAATPDGSDINTSGTQSGTHTLHVADGRMVSDGYYSSKAHHLIGRVAVTNTTGNWGSPTEVSLPPIFTGRQVFLGPANTTNLNHTNASYQDFSSPKITIAFVAPKTGRYLIATQVPMYSTANGARSGLKLTSSVGSPTVLASLEGITNEPSGINSTVTNMVAHEIVWLTMGTPYSWNAQGKSTSGATTARCDTPGSGCFVWAEQLD